MMNAMIALAQRGAIVSGIRAHRTNAEIAEFHNKFCLRAGKIILIGWIRLKILVCPLNTLGKSL